MCVDPVTATLIASTTIAAGSAVYSGMSANKLANKQASAIEATGRLDLMGAQHEESALRRDNRRALSRQRSQVLSTGLDPSSGTAAEIVAEDARLAELDALMVRYGGESANARAKADAHFRRQEGKAARTAGFLNAAATVIGSSSDWGAFRKAGPAVSSPRGGSGGIDPGFRRRGSLNG